MDLPGLPAGRRKLACAPQWQCRASPPPGTPYKRRRHQERTWTSFHPPMTGLQTVAETRTQTGRDASFQSGGYRLGYRHPYPLPLDDSDSVSCSCLICKVYGDGQTDWICTAASLAYRPRCVQGGGCHRPQGAGKPQTTGAAVATTVVWGLGFSNVPCQGMLAARSFGSVRPP